MTEVIAEPRVSPELVKLHEHHSREDLLLKIQRLMGHYDRAVSTNERYREGFINQANEIDDLKMELSAVIDVADGQDDILQEVAEFLDEWEMKDAPPGSRARSVQIAVGELGKRLMQIDAVQRLNALLDEEDSESV